MRATKELDVLVAGDDATASGLGDLIERWGATRPDGTPEPRSLPSTGRALHLRTEHGLFDVLMEGLPPSDLSGFLSRADERRVDGVPAPICSLADLVLLKRAAGRPGDLEDLRRLETAHGELPSPPRGG